MHCNCTLHKKHTYHINYTIKSLLNLIFFIVEGGASSKDAANIIGESNFGEVTSTPSKGTTRRGKSKARPKSVCDYFLF